MFVKQEIPNLKTHIERLMKTKGVSYLLHFRGHGHDNTAIIQSLICRFPTHIQKNLQSLFRQKRKWGGCFGISSLISHEGVSDLVRNGLDSLWRGPLTREERMGVERVFSLLCIVSGKVQWGNPSILGELGRYNPRAGTYYWKDYKDDLTKGKLQPVMKVWNGR